MTFAILIWIHINIIRIRDLEMTDEQWAFMLSENEEEQGDNEYYGFLNVPRNASNAEITAAYKRLARLYHPDKHQVQDYSFIKYYRKKS